MWRVPLSRPTWDSLNPWPKVCGWLLTSLWPCSSAGSVLWGTVRSWCTVLVCLLVARRGPIELSPYRVCCRVHPVMTRLCRSRPPTPSAPVTEVFRRRSRVETMSGWLWPAWVAGIDLVGSVERDLSVHDWAESC